jgi:hypothetical protein
LCVAGVQILCEVGIENGRFVDGFGIAHRSSSRLVNCYVGGRLGQLSPAPS